MGKKKKFIDKKKSATFQLMTRDTSDPNYSSEPSGDQVFVRVDNNGYMSESFMKEDGIDGNVLSKDSDSIFADVPDDEDGGNRIVGSHYYEVGNEALPDHVRKEILELGFPDDGYDYLTHLRDIKNRGGGAVYYSNPKASSGPLPQDVKAYDSSRVEVSKMNGISVEKSIYSVASNTVGVRLQKVVDLEVAAMLDDSDSSKFASDVDELEEDFVFRANLLEGPVDEDFDKELGFVGRSSDDHAEIANFDTPENGDESLESGTKKPRVRRPLDEQFDMLELVEYDNDENSDYVDEQNECQEFLAEKLNHAFKDHPLTLLHDGKGTDDVESMEVTVDVIDRCKEYAAKYEDDSHEEMEVLVESSEESEVWDCETIISTYSTLDNHPGRIVPPEITRKKLANAIFGAYGGPNQLIALKGKEKLPVDYLPQSRKNVEQKAKDEKHISKKIELQKRKTHGEESKEEKKERKTAVKLERREAREKKKEMKVLYKSEAQQAQKVAAFSSPSTIHLM